MPNRDARDFIGDFRITGIPIEDIKIIVRNMESVVKAGVSLKDLETIAQNIIKDSKFRANFLKDPMSAVSRVGAAPTPHP